MSRSAVSTDLHTGAVSYPTVGVREAEGTAVQLNTQTYTQGLLVIPQWG